MVNATWSEDKVAGSSGEGVEPTAVALTTAEVLELLPAYVEGTLPVEVSREIEGHVAREHECAVELRRLRAEEDLLSEALSELRPDASFRARVARMCVDVHRHATTVANALPERGWAAFRWSLALLAVVYFCTLALILEPPTESAGALNLERLLDRHPPLYWVNVMLLTLSLFLLIGGRLAAVLASWLSARLGGRAHQGPSRLEVLTLEALGICGVLATSVYHYLQLVS